ncbi:MAG: branched-chain amino acid ABC transporter substrate-binding protein, partial [Acetobacteraceae bacterium]|nr:branched-chain amino acid ABC transporter substrate-binding protein [Acetobacteraceae bacterium]
MRRFWLALASCSALATQALAAPQTVKIAFIDPLSGGAASVGESALKTFNFLADRLNAKGGDYRFEFVPYDNKLNPQESIVALQKAIDGGARIVTQGNGSAVAAALIDFLNKYNERNPGKEVLYLNYSAVEPSLTNEKCSYWHFRFDANSDVKMEALTSFMKGRPEIKKVYLLNQDYSFGQAFRTAARQMLKEKRPDIAIVGDEVTPLQKVTDFSPYVAKIKAAGADTVLTGNWGQDIALLFKAAGDAGLDVGFYTYYAGGTGAPTAIRQANLPNRVFEISEARSSALSPAAVEFETAFKAKTGEELTYPRVINMMSMVEKAMDEAKSADPKALAAKLEGMHIDAYAGGDEFMRKDDHQIFQPMFIASLGPRRADTPF